MKEKRYFCDYWSGNKGSIKIIYLIIFLSFIIISSISSIISYNVLLLKHGNELNSYSESTYQYLNEIADNVIREGAGINLLALPDDVVNYEITIQDNEVIFKYYLDNNKGMEYAASADMTVKLSDNYEIISKEPNYSSEEDYISDIKGAMIFQSVMLGFVIWLCVMLVAFIGGTIADFVSKTNKYLSKKNTESN